MFLVMHPDPMPPAHVAHCCRGYTVVLRDRLGRPWFCTYPAQGARRCKLLSSLV